jgi:hypothetical protein
MIFLRIVSSVHISQNETIARTQALTWGWQCDGYLAFLTESIPQLGVMNMTHVGDESYDDKHVANGAIQD